MKLNKTQVFFFDLDGVLSVGRENPRYIGGRDVVRKIKALGKKAFVLTNQSTQSREQTYRNLTRLEFSFEFDEILTSSSLTALYLREKFEETSFFLVGEDGLRLELEALGHRETNQSPTVVVVGLDRNLSYEKLDHALACLREGSELIGSYGGAVYMSEHGPALSAGPIIRALEYASGKRATMIGKPSPRMFKLALSKANEKPERAVMVGDQIETDLLGAHSAGIRTILVLSGVETRESISHSKIKPNMVVESVDALLDLI